ncbi:MAG: hypothetical protein QOH47_2772 [Sphingomonadales bacterium]|jgi:hypothetical protein|nr:hypothetical protein [Sphingomonadales bacterium]
MTNFRSRTRRWLFAAAACALLIPAGCNRPASEAAAGEAPASQPSAVRAESPGNAILRNAAEPFEALTEQAFAAPWPEADRLIADGGSAAARARGILPDPAADMLDARLAAIAAARQAQDRPGLALAAVETYRHLVQAQDGATAQVPIPISLLDYAGFRYDALAQAPNVDWAAMDQAARFAGDQWRAIQPSIASPSLRGVMPQSIGAMSAAVRQRDVPFARSAAATELALVDLLEEHAAAQQRGAGR